MVGLPSFNVRQTLHGTAERCSSCRFHLFASFTCFDGVPRGRSSVAEPFHSRARFRFGRLLPSMPDRAHRLRFGRLALPDRETQRAAVREGEPREEQSGNGFPPDGRQGRQWPMKKAAGVATGGSPHRQDPLRRRTRQARWLAGAPEVIPCPWGDSDRGNRKCSMDAEQQQP